MAAIEVEESYMKLKFLPALDTRPVHGWPGPPTRPEPDIVRARLGIGNPARKKSGLARNPGKNNLKSENYLFNTRAC